MDTPSLGIWIKLRIPTANAVKIFYDLDLYDGNAYPSRVEYGGLTGWGEASRASYGVEFLWKQGLPVSTNYFQGFPSMVNRWLDSIKVRLLHDGTTYSWDYSPIREYDFDIDLEAPGGPVPMKSVMLLDGDGQALSRADGNPAATTFDYASQLPGYSVSEGGSFGPGQSYDGPGTVPDTGTVFHGSVDRRITRTLIDMNGDGIPDIVDAGSKDLDEGMPWQVWFGTRDGYRESSVPWSAPVGAIQDTSNSNTHFDTVDINGDGIPDFVDARADDWTLLRPYWKVYLGRNEAADILADGWGFETTPILWRSPRLFVRRTEQYLQVLGHNGSAKVQELMDMNADGLPDLVWVDPVDNGPIEILYNNGAGFVEFSFEIRVVISVLEFTANGGNSISRLQDMNGDGLPDLILKRDASAEPWEVYFHTGLAFEPSPVEWRFPVDCHWSISFAADDEARRDLIDMNGDGLSDLVETCDGFSWSVYLNDGTGNIASTPITWESPSKYISRNDNGETSWSLRDFDGDGFPDLRDFKNKVTYRNMLGAWCASDDGATCSSASGTPTTTVANLLATKPHVLLETENGMGGAVTLAYRPSSEWDNRDQAMLNLPDGEPVLSRMPYSIWTITRIESDNGLPGSVPGSHGAITELSYAGGKFVAEAREFRGFKVVDSRDGRGIVYRTHYAQDAIRKGRVLAQGVIADQQEWTQNTWTCEKGGIPQSCPELRYPGRRWVIRQSQTTKMAFSPGTGDIKRRWARNLAWDQYGNIIHSAMGGDDSGEIHNFVEYGHRDENDAYIVDKPIHLWTTSENQGEVAAEKWFYYDNMPYAQIDRANSTMVESWLDQGAGQALPCIGNSSKRCVRTTSEYDQWGNPVRVSDANGNSIRTAYDGIYHLYPEHETNALGHVVTKLYNPRCGKLVEQTLPYREGETPAPASLFRFDSFCRPTEEILPGAQLNVPQRKFFYFLGTEGQPTTVRVAAVEPNAPNASMVDTDKLIDSFGRSLQTQTLNVIDGVATIVASGTVVYDDRGNAVEAYAPFTISGQTSSGAAIYAPPPPRLSSTITTYDALNRVVEVMKPSGNVTRIDYDTAWEKETIDECATSGDCDGASVRQVQDALERLIEKQVYDRSTSAPALKMRTQYIYDAMGRVVQTMQGDATAWNPATAITSTYDSLGRKVSLHDPDSGLWSYGYDAAGNLRYQDDPKEGQNVQFCYDAINRLIYKQSILGDISGLVDLAPCGPSSGGAAVTTYSYDSAENGLGEIARVDSLSGWTEFRRYDLRRQPLLVEKAVEINGQVEVALFGYTYDDAGHVTRTTYPDGENVDYSYNEVGQVVRIASNNMALVYLEDMTYDIFGRPLKIQHGNGVSDEREYYDENEDYRLSRILVRKPENKGHTTCLTDGNYLDLSYKRYTARGKVKEIDDNSSCRDLSNAVTYRYDGLGRLTKADYRRVSSFDRDYAHDDWGNLIAKGDLDFEYSASHPHRLQVIDGSPVGYDANGNRATKSGQDYRYDTEDRLIGIVAESGEVHIAYGHDGMMVRKQRVSSGAIAEQVRYFGSLMERKTGSEVEYRTTKHYFAGGTRIASRETTWVPQLALHSEDDIQNFLVQMESSESKFLAAVGNSPGWLLVAMVVGLLLVPGHRRAALGMMIRRGQILALLMVWSTVSLGGLGILGPQAAFAGGSSSGPPNPGPVLHTVHYHGDHLGSAQVMTTRAGGVMEHLRYTPYGELRGRFDHAGEDAAKIYSNYEFTTYQSDMTSGLQYAGARWYDPEVGQFLNHDPKRQYASPYAYGPGDPVNGTDPNGELFGVCLGFILGFIVGALISGIQAAVNGASVGQAFKAAAIGGAISGAMSVVLPGVGSAIGAAFGPIAQAAVQVAMVGYGAYSTVKSFEADQFVSGAFGVANLVGGLYAVGKSISPETRILGIDVSKVAGSVGGAIQRFGAAARGILVDDLRGFAGMVVGAPYQLGRGIYRLGAGILSGNSALLKAGLLDLIGAGLPKFGGSTGLGWPGTEDAAPIVPIVNNPLDAGASTWHDGEDLFKSSSQFGWITRAWTGGDGVMNVSDIVGLGPYGQAVRIFGTASFGTIGSFQYGSEVVLGLQSPQGL